MTSVKLAPLLALAAEDLQLAKQASTPPRPAAYHLSQAAEKIARAVCEHEEIPVGITHNIGQIGAFLPDNHPMRELIEAQNYQSSASTKYRYPDPAGRIPQAPSPEEILRRLADVTAFLNAVTEFVRLPRDSSDGDRR